jgi:TPR repeat protein
MYENGRGVPLNAAEAARWYRKAADQGNAHAQAQLGLMYANGTGVPRDDTEAARWYRKTADQGNTNAQFTLGGMYESGTGVPRDLVEAYKWNALAAAGGESVASAAHQERDRVERLMTPSQIAEGQQRAREWVAHSEEEKKR